MDVDRPQVEVVRSGTVTPTVCSAIRITYLPPAHTRPGAQFAIDVRGKHAGAEVVKMPFVPNRTKR